MASLTVFVLLALLTMVSSQDQTKESLNKESTCADMMQSVNDCLDRLQDSQDALMFQDRRKQIFRKCVPNQSAQCSGQFAAMEKCNDQVRGDQTLRKSRDEVKSNVANCYERFPNTRKTGGGRPFPPPVAPGPMAAPQGPQAFPRPMPQQGFVQDPCAPTSEQMLCIKHTTDTDKNITTLAASLHGKERQCFTSNPNMINCRPDNSQLRECLDQTAQTFMQQVGEKMKKCVRDAGYDVPALPPPPPHAFSG